MSSFLTEFDLSKINTTISKNQEWMNMPVRKSESFSIVHYLHIDYGFVFPFMGI